jgi:hypothetical protein
MISVLRPRTAGQPPGPNREPTGETDVFSAAVFGSFADEPDRFAAPRRRQQPDLWVPAYRSYQVAQARLVWLLRSVDLPLDQGAHDRRGLEGWRRRGRPRGDPPTPGSFGCPGHAASRGWIRLWLISQVYAVLGRAGPAQHDARPVLDLCQEHGIGGFDLAFAYEALARAHAAAGDTGRAPPAWRHVPGWTRWNDTEYPVQHGPRGRGDDQGCRPYRRRCAPRSRRALTT